MFVIFIGRDNWWSLYLSKASCSRQCLVPAAVQHPPATSFDVLTAIDTLWALRDMPTISGKIIGYNGDIMWYIYTLYIYIHTNLGVSKKRRYTKHSTLIGKLMIQHQTFRGAPFSDEPTWNSQNYRQAAGWGTLVGDQNIWPKDFQNVDVMW